MEPVPLHEIIFPPRHFVFKNAGEFIRGIHENPGVMGEFLVGLVFKRL
ncbi:MAG: hypothetical protein ACTSUE_22180 [Promethearchaeota archaeon]